MPEVRASLKSTLQVLLRDEAAIGRAAGTNPVSKVLPGLWGNESAGATHPLAASHDASATT